MNKKTVFRNKAVACTALVAFALLCSTSCTKPIDGAQNRPLDYALQVIPDIHEVMPHDLLEAVGVEKLHFGDNPPKLSLDSLGFARKPAVIYDYIKYDSTTSYSLIVGEPKFYTFFFKFSDQHRGIAKYDFKCQYIDSIYGGVDHQYYIEYAHVEDSVFIMGDAPYFTAYFNQNRIKESSISTIVDYGSHEATILTGEVTPTGIKDLYYAMKITGYDNPVDAGDRCLNINDIVIFYIEFLPFRYWDPTQHYNN